MISTGLKEFLKALETVKNDYICSVCSDICKNPVTLSKCFHIICSEHLDDIKVCPTCKTDLEGCKIFLDNSLTRCVEATKELDKLFQGYVSDLSRTEVSTLDKANTLVKNENLGIETEKRPGRPKRQASKTSSVCKKEDCVKDEKKPTPAKKRTSNDALKGNQTSKRSDTKRTRNKKASVNTSNSSAVTKCKSTDAECMNETNISTRSSKLNKTIEKRNNKGETQLHVACRLGNIERIIELLKQGANANTKDNAGWTPLHEVTQNGRLDLVKVLLQYNALIDVPGQGNETPLHEAVRYKHEGIAVELTKHGANIHARNCKGETPYQLASINMKTTLLAAAVEALQSNDNVIQPLLQFQIEFDEIRVHCVSQFSTIQTKLKVLEKHHSNLTIESKFSKRVTHLIVDSNTDGVCSTSLEILQGIVNSIWIITSEWINKSTEDKLEPFDKYEVVGVGNKTYKGPINSRYNKYKLLPGIFDGCHFYLHDFNNKYEISKNLILTKASLSKLLTDAGGSVLHRVPNPESIPEQEKLVPYHASKDGKLYNCSHYIIFKDMYQPMYNMQHLKALPIGWLIECLEKYELCEPWDI